MKIIISESQYSKLISQITGKEMKQNFFSFIKNLLNRNKDQEVGQMILQSVKEGRYDFDSIDRLSAKFAINGFLIEIHRKVGYHLYLPFVGRERLKVSGKICKKIFYEIADKHMTYAEHLHIWMDDEADNI